jgi:hypothetical protein
MPEIIDLIVAISSKPKLKKCNAVISNESQLLFEF